MILASCVGVAACLLLSTPVQAATAYYWDANGTGSGNYGGTGTWDTTLLNWYTGSTNVVWPNTGGNSGSVAVLFQNAGTITIAAGGVTVGNDTNNGGVKVGTSGYTLTGGPLYYDGTGSNTDWSIFNLVGATSLTISNDTVITTNNAASTGRLFFAKADTINTTVTVNGNIGLSATETGGTKYMQFVGNGTGANFIVNGSIKNYASAGSGAKLSITMGGNATNQTLTLTGSNSFSGGLAARMGKVVVTDKDAAGTGDITLGEGSAAFLTGAALTISNNIILPNYTTSLVAAIGSNSTGVSNYTGTITRQNTSTKLGTLALTAVTGGTVNFSGKITDGSTGTIMPIVKVGQGVVNLSYAQGSNYGGGTNVTEGTLLVNNTSGSATGTGAVKVNSVAASSSASYTGTARSYTYTVASTAGLVVGQSVTGTNIPDGTYIVSIDSSTQISLNSVPNISATSGATSGTLNFGAVSGTLGGTGIIAGATTVSSGATIAPGNLSVGALTLQNGLDLQGTYIWEINANSESTGFDKIILSGGDLTLGAGSILEIRALAGVDFANEFWKTNHSWNIVDNTGSGTVKETFFGLTGDTVYTEGSFSLSYGTGSGADAVLTWAAVPEPSTWAMIVGGMGMLAFGQRLRRRS